MKQEILDIAPMILSRAIFYWKSQHWSLDKIHAYQDKKLKRLIKHSYEHVPYYRKLFKEIGLDVDHFRGREDMAKIPILDKETVRTCMEQFIADNFKKYPYEWDTTSGSTGTPLKLMISKKTKAAKHAAIFRSYSWAGYQFGKRALTLSAQSSSKALPSFNRLRNVLRISSYSLTPGTASMALEMINSLKPKIFLGNSYSLIWLGNYALERKIDFPMPESIITYGDTLSARKRELLETLYQCEVYDFYSHHESVAIVSECENHSMHIFDDFAYNEIINEQGEDVAHERTGKLVGTGFHNYAMPLIRYDTRDLVEVQKGKKCSCGRNLNVIERITGRQNDILETPDGRFISNNMEHSIDKGRGVILSQCVQDAIDHIYVNLIVDEMFGEDSWNTIKSDLKRRLGGSMKFEYRIVDELEKNKGGKTPFILSKIGHSYE